MADFAIHHVNLLVDDAAAALRFYGDVLGLERIEPPDQGFESLFFVLSPSQQLHLNVLPDAKPYRAHVCLVVPDFAACFRRMKEAGAIDTAPWGRVRQLPSGKMQMFVRDPSGNLLEIASADGDPASPASLADPELVEPQRGIYRIDAEEPRPPRAG